MSRNVRYVRGALSLAVAMALSPTAFAQQAPAKDDAEAVKLDVVEVTAQRRVENIQEVPMAITTLGGEKLDVIGSGGDDIRVLSARLPSLQIESSFGRAFPRFYIRGLGNTDFDLNASQPVSLIYDDVVQENPILKGFPIFDLEQIEMARGPQGTLFGRNSPAGVIKFNSVRPHEDADGYAKVSWGRYGTTNLEGAVGGGLSDGLSGRFSVLHQRRGDWVDNTRTPGADDLEGYRETAARSQLLFSGREGFEALANVHMRSLDGTARLFRANIIQAGSNDFVPGFRRDQVSYDGRNEQELDQLGGSLRMRWDLDRISVYSITGYETVEAYSRGDIDGGYGASFFAPSGPGFIPFDAESADGLPDHSQFTQELRLESREWGRMDWQAGLYYFNESLTIDSFNYSSTFGAGAQNGYAKQQQDNTAWAAFSSMDYDVNDRFKLRAGLRYTHDRKDFVAQRFDSPIDFLGASETVGPIYVDTRGSHVSWDVSGTWTVNDQLNAYVRVAEGFRAPAIQGRLLFGDVVSVADTETVLSWEAGIKGEFLDNRVRMGLGVFRYTLDNQQLTAVGGSSNFNTLINADQVIGQGVELDLDAYITDRLLMTAGLSINDTEIKDPNLAVQVCGSGCTVLDRTRVVGGNTLALINGNSLPNAPKVIGNVTARYGVPVADGEFFVFTDWAYRSKVNFFLYDSAEFRGDAMLEGGLRVGYNWNYGDREIALFGRNITDELALVGAIDFNNLTGMVNEPRMWGVEFKAKF